MKKIVLSLAFLFSALTFGLWVFTKVSSAHVTAIKAIFSSPDLTKELGVIETVVLTKYSQKTGPTGKGCTTLTYYLFGAINDDWTQVRLLNAGYGSGWKVVEIKMGYGSALTVDCVYG